MSVGYLASQDFREAGSEQSAPRLTGARLTRDMMDTTVSVDRFDLPASARACCGPGRRRSGDPPAAQRNAGAVPPTMSVAMAELSRLGLWRARAVRGAPPGAARCSTRWAAGAGHVLGLEIGARGGAAAYSLDGGRSAPRGTPADRASDRHTRGRRRRRGCGAQSTRGGRRDHGPLREVVVAGRPSPHRAPGQPAAGRHGDHPRRAGGARGRPGDRGEQRQLRAVAEHRFGWPATADVRVHPGGREDRRRHRAGRPADARRQRRGRRGGHAALPWSGTQDPRRPGWSSSSARTR